MCCCAKPNVNGTPGYSWDGKQALTRPVDPPDLQDGDVLLYDEPGRCGGLDCHCHHYRVVKSYSSLYLLVRHGGGDERFRLCNPSGERSTISYPLGLDAMDSDTRYWLLNALYHAYYEGRKTGKDSESARWRRAAAEKRIKVRKVRGQDQVKVTIETLITTAHQEVA